MRLTVFGPTGATGEQIVRQALTAGHEVTAVARQPEAVRPAHRQLRAVAGDVLNPAPSRLHATFTRPGSTRSCPRRSRHPPWTGCFTTPTSSSLKENRSVSLRLWAGRGWSR